MKPKPFVRVKRGPRPLNARASSWPAVAFIALALTVGTGAGHQLRANAVGWIDAIAAATHRAAAKAVESIDRIDAAHADARADDAPYLVERDRVAQIERICDSDKPLIALVVAALLVVLAVLDRLDAALADDSFKENSGAAPRTAEAGLFEPHAIEPAPRSRSRIEYLGAQNESEIIARHDDRPATHSVAAVLRDSIN